MATSIAKSVIGSKASKKAASQMAEAANEAANEAREQFRLSSEDIQKQKAQNRTDLQPFLTTGTNANNTLGYLLGLQDTDTSGGILGTKGSLSKPFTMADYEADPGYKFRLEEGMKALDRANAAKGKYFSGGAIKALTDYNQKSASQEYQSAYDRYNTNQSNLYNKLAGTAASGQNAANTLASTGDTLTLGQANLGAGKAAAVGEGIIGAGNAHAAGTIGQGQAWVTGLDGLQKGLFKMGGMMAGGGA